MPAIQPIHFALGNADINIELPDSDVAQALLTNHPFPVKEVSVGQAAIKVTATHDISLDGGKGKVAFTANGGVYSSIGVYQAGDNLAKALQVRDLDDSIVAGLRFPNDAGSNLIALLWGYNAGGTIKGEVGLGAGGVTFGLDANASGLFAVIRQLPRNSGAFDAVSQTVNSWKLPVQVKDLNDLAPGTWLIAETNSSIALSLGVQYGYEFSWVREALSLGGLSGDIGLKVSLGVMASLGFDASGRYALAISREIDKPTIIRLRVFNLKRKGWTVALNASAGAVFDPGSFAPDHLEEFIKSVFNIQGLQIIKDLERWTSKDNTIAELLGADLETYAKGLLQQISGVDLDTAENYFKDFVSKWNALPHEITSLIYSRLPDQGLVALRTFLQKIVDNATPAAIAQEISNHIGGAQFHETAIGEWLSASTIHGLTTLLNSQSELTLIHDLAQKTLAILDGSTVEGILTELQKWFDGKLGLDKILAAADPTAIDAWLRARLTAFLGHIPLIEDLEKIKTAINAIRAKSDEFYKKGIEALTRKYTVEFAASYNKSITNTALLDLEFDFGANPADAAMSNYLKPALDGKFDEILLKQLPGIHLNAAALTHEVKRSTHIEINLPFTSVVLDHINDSLVTQTPIDTADGRMFVYDLDAKDLVSRRNRRDSQLAVGLHFSENTSVRKFGEGTYTYDYSMRLVQRNMKQQFLRYQFKSLVTTYFRPEFEGPGKSSFDTYVSDLAKAADSEHPGTNNLGNGLLSLTVGLPSEVVAAWRKAPLGDHDKAYMNQSIVIQQMLKSLIPFCYFQDVTRYQDLKAAIPLLVYSSLPPLNHCSLNGNQLKLNDGTGIYWDWMDSALRSALIYYNETRTSLLSRLGGIREVLTAIPELQEQVDFYQDIEADKMFKQAVEDDYVIKMLTNLLYVESQVINGARDAGVAFAKFFGEIKPDKAYKLLTDFGSKLTDTFNSAITSAYKGDSVRSLGTMIFIEAARALDPDLGAIEPTSILDLILLKQGAEFIPEDFLKNRWPPTKDAFLAQRLINPGTVGA